MQINLHSYVVRGSDGSVDAEATIGKFGTDLARYIAERETEQETIANAVHAVFDHYKGASLNMPALVSMTLTKLNAQPESFKALSDRVLSFVRENAQGETKDGVSERPNSLFVIGKGKGGGVKRRSDIPKA